MGSSMEQRRRSKSLLLVSLLCGLFLVAGICGFVAYIFLVLSWGGPDGWKTVNHYLGLWYSSVLVFMSSQAIIALFSAPKTSKVRNAWTVV